MVSEQLTLLASFLQHALLPANAYDCSTDSIYNSRLIISFITGFADQRQFNRLSVRRGPSRGGEQELRRTLSGSPNVNDSRAAVHNPAAAAFGKWQRKCSSMRVARERFASGENGDPPQL